MVSRSFPQQDPGPLTLLCFGRQIHDDDAPDIADAFYHYLFRQGLSNYPDSTQAAEALHLAVKELRANKNVTFRRWVPFIHFGM